MKSPILLYGPQASGKNHIAHAIAMGASGGKAVYINAKDFPSPFDTLHNREQLYIKLNTDNTVIIEEFTSEKQIKRVHQFLRGFYANTVHNPQVIFTTQKLDVYTLPQVYQIECTYHLHEKHDRR